MKKQVALAVAAALSLSVAGTALAAPANPFVDVPANHWAYDALAQLQKSGVVTGYGDGTFRGDRNLTRYEMAAMIAKITIVDDKNGPVIKRLQSEFATELYNLGVRVDKLEKGASTIKFTGDARIRYQRLGEPAPGIVRSSRFQERIRIYMTAKVNDNINFYGRLHAINESNVRNNAAFGNNDKVSRTGDVYFDRAEFAWKNNNWNVSAGRMLPKLGQGIFAWNDRADGIIAGYNDGKFSAMAGVIDIGTRAAQVWGPIDTSLNVSMAQLGYKFTDKFAMTAMYANAHGSDANGGGSETGSVAWESGKQLKPWSIGASLDFAKDWNLRGEYIKNTGEERANGTRGNFNKNGFFTRLTYGTAKMSTPGTWSAYAEYIKFGRNSGALAGNASAFDITDSGIGNKGWGVGVTYVVGKNHNMQLFYHDLKTIDGTRDPGKQYTIATNFNF